MSTGTGRLAPLATGFFCCLLLIPLDAPASARHDANAVSADQALVRLVQGNQRYAQNKAHHPNQTLARRRELEAGQHPFAVILSCADSRVPPELIFDQGLGDLFVIRVAGNIADNDDLGSIEYAVEQLDIKLIVVLGHEKCGAVTAAVEGANEPGHLKAIISAIQAAIQEAKNLPGDRIHNCMLANVRHVARQIRGSEPVLKDLIQKDGVKVVAAYYALDSGVVTLLDQNLP